MRTPIAMAVTALLSVALAGTAAGTAEAQTVVNCDDLPNPVYVQAGDTQEPLLKDLGKRLRDSGNPDQEMTLIYLATGSCTNIAAMYANTPITTNPKYIPSLTQDPTWTPAAASPTCTINAAGHTLDLANSAVQIASCTTDATPDGIEVHQGANQSYVFIVPAASSQIAITAEEAYFVFGFGMAGMANPWINEALMFIRTVTKSTLLSMAANIRVPAAKWHGVKLDQSADVASMVAASQTPEPTIGILGGEVYDTQRNTLKALAFRAYQQNFAYFPDSTSTSFDKQNLRDGHYTIWSPTIWMGRTATLAANPRAQLLLDLILGKVVTPDAGFSGLDVVISHGLVPQCAMKVSRQVEGGDLSVFTPDEPCGCHFESQVNVTDAACVACDPVTAPCATGACRLGFCEAR